MPGTPVGGLAWAGAGNGGINLSRATAGGASTGIGGAARGGAGAGAGSGAGAGAGSGDAPNGNVIGLFSTSHRLAIADLGASGATAPDGSAPVGLEDVVSLEPAAGGAPAAGAGGFFLRKLNIVGAYVARARGTGGRLVILASLGALAQLVRATES